MNAVNHCARYNHKIHVQVVDMSQTSDLRSTLNTDPSSLFDPPRNHYSYAMVVDEFL